jgi:hypothetical protein
MAKKNPLGDTCICSTDWGPGCGTTTRIGKEFEIDIHDINILYMYTTVYTQLLSSHCSDLSHWASGLCACGQEVQVSTKGRA